MGTEVTTALTTALSGIAGDATDVILVIVPIAIGVAGLVFVIRKAMGWFKSLAK